MAGYVRARTGDSNPAMQAILVAMAVLLAPAPAAGHWGGAEPGLASIEVYDRQDGTTLPFYDGQGRRWVVGTPGHEYALRIRNHTGERILAVASVDGVNVVTGETASPDQSGYVIDGYGSVEIQGWRKSLQRTAAFYFTDLGDSYAARTGRPNNVGVIGVAVFREQKRVASPPYPFREKIARADRPSGAAGLDNAAPAVEPMAAMPPAAGAAASPPAPDRDAERASADARLDGSSAKQATASPLGTGHGRNETSYATRVSFVRASTSPAQVLAVSYDRRDTLAAMGILSSPSYYARRPEAFPGTMRFVPDPR